MGTSVQVMWHNEWYDARVTKVNEARKRVQVQYLPPFQSSDPIWKEAFELLEPYGPEDKENKCIIVREGLYPSSTQVASIRGDGTVAATATASRHTGAVRRKKHNKRKARANQDKVDAVVRKLPSRPCALSPTLSRGVLPGV